MNKQAQPFSLYLYWGLGAILGTNIWALRPAHPLSWTNTVLEGGIMLGLTPAASFLVGWLCAQAKSQWLAFTWFTLLLCVWLFVPATWAAFWWGKGPAVARLIQGLNLVEIVYLLILVGISFAARGFARWRLKKGRGRCVGGY